VAELAARVQIETKEKRHFLVFDQQSTRVRRPDVGTLLPGGDNSIDAYALGWGGQDAWHVTAAVHSDGC